MALESEFARAVRSTFEQGNRAWNEGDIERAYRALGDDFEYELAPPWPQSRPLRGRAEVVSFFRDFRETFPDARTGPLAFVEVGGFGSWRIEKGQVAEHWGVFDVMRLLRSIGVLPEEAPAGSTTG